MTIYDSELAEIIKSQTPVEINGLQYIIEPNRSGSCDGCAFIGSGKCPQRAVTYCCSNGGNILVKANQTKNNTLLVETKLKKEYGR